MKSAECTLDLSSEFIIRVLPGNSAPDQGTALHVKSGETRSFYTYLELVLFVQEMLEQYGPTQREGNMRSWPEDSSLQDAEDGEEANG